MIRLRQPAREFQAVRIPVRTTLTLRAGRATVTLKAGDILAVEPGGVLRALPKAALAAAGLEVVDDEAAAPARKTRRGRIRIRRAAKPATLKVSGTRGGGSGTAAPEAASGKSRTTYTSEQRAHARKLFEGGLSLPAAGEKAGVPYHVVYRWKSIDGWEQ